MTIKVVYFQFGMFWNFHLIGAGIGPKNQPTRIKGGNIAPIC
jgi:hypothetical protein